ncbi:MAG TPA: hypothetical protein VLD61_10120 [Methylomirabilota bacterium]|nr:hypothetical protein [Methylomirabilota bacterium]
MVGHNTEAIYWRYAIVDDEAMLREGADKLARVSVPSSDGTIAGTVDKSLVRRVL